MPTAVDLEGATSSWTEEALEELEIDLGDEEAEDKLSPLIQVLDDEARRDEVFEQLRAVCQTILDAGRAKKAANAALFAAREAHTILTEIDLTSAEPKTYDGIVKQLQSVIKRAGELVRKVERARSGGPSQDAGAAPSK